MKNLYIIRHAKSSWEFDIDDHKRPLNQRGYEDAELVGKHLKSIVKSIDLIKSSDAVRAKTTAEIIVNHLELPEKEILLESKLYDFEGTDVIEVIKSTDRKVDSLMIFGHNHALTSIINRYGHVSLDNLPTAGVAIIKFDIEDWSEINVGNTLLTIFPKQLR